LTDVPRRLAGDDTGMPEHDTVRSRSRVIGDATIALQQDDDLTQFVTVNQSGIDRVHRLRVLLEATTQEMLAARRQSARLRVENQRLARQIAEPQAPTVSDRATLPLAHARGR